MREAQAAGLNHSNICTVFEVDEANGFLAMELVEGVSVKERIAERPLPLAEALDIAIQACAGFQHAHEKGVVHRDVKPANLMINAEGQVKIMDFGLAQVGDRTRITKTGESVGTPAYMSPEQVQGKPADRRSDIWSVGVSLHEMITGRAAFPGETEAATAYGILNREPEPLTAIRSGLPVELDRIAAKCLRKRAEERYQNMADLRVDLLSLRGTPERPTRNAGIGSHRALAAALAGLAAAGALLWVGLASRTMQAPAVMRMTLPLPAGAMAADPGRLLGSPRVSPDGEAVVVALATGDTSHLYVRRLNRNSLERLEGTRGAVNPFWSPDSKSIAFFADGQLKRIAPAGGTPQIVSMLPSGGSRGGAWGANGNIIFGVNPKGLFRVSEMGGEPAALTELNPALGENSHRYPVFLPDGNRFLYFARTSKQEHRGIYLDSLDHKAQRRRVLVADGQFAFGRDPASGQYHLLTQQSGKIVAEQFDLQTGAVTGVSRVISENGGQVSVSETGLMVIRSETQDLSRLVWMDRSGREIGSIGPPGDYWDIRLSPDERSAAVTKHDYLSGYFAVWLVDLARGYLAPLSAEPNRCVAPVWSPDSQFVFFSRSEEPRGIFRRAAQGSADEELFDRAAEGERISDISVSGEQILAERKQSNNRSTIVGTSRISYEWQAIGAAGEAQLHPRFSPDGRWIAYDSNQTGEREVYVMDRAHQSHRVSSKGGMLPVWRGDGKEIFYLSQDGYLTSVDTAGSSGWKASAPKPLFRVVLQKLIDGTGFDVSRDGQRFLVILGKDRDAQSSLDVILNWTSLLR